MRRSIIFVTLLVAMTARPLPAGEVKTGIPGVGPELEAITKADPVTAGAFDGTWMYMNRDGRWALWIRTKDGVPQARMQYQSLASPEAFETDWDGKARYYLGGNPVTFDLKVGKSGKDQILATWDWLLTIDTSARHEKADIVIYRTGYGRTLLMDFQNYDRTITRFGKDTVTRTPVNWTWNKISKRELLWDELPF